MKAFLQVMRDELNMKAVKDMVDSPYGIRLWNWHLVVFTVWAVSFLAWLLMPGLAVWFVFKGNIILSRIVANGFLISTPLFVLTYVLLRVRWYRYVKAQQKG